MDVYVARQPVLNAERKTCGYELLFRDGLSNAFPDIDGETATTKVLADSFLTIGMDQLTGGKKAFINFTPAMLLKKVPLMFPKDKMTIEVLEDVKPDEDILAACRELRAQGYDLALDDFCYQPGMESLVSISRIVKLDFMATPLDKNRKMVAELSRYKVHFLAEKVETYDVFKAALDMGCTYFQGYFFSRPEIIKGKDISPARVTLLQILAEVNKPDFDFKKLERLITQDVSMSYKLLRYINSAYFRRVQEINSIKHAILLLGEREVRRFISLLGVSALSDKKPGELVVASIIRARLCELLGKYSSTKYDLSELFTLGLFSFIDAIMDDTIERLMRMLPLSASIKNALINKEGPLSGFLDLAGHYESGNWEAVNQLATGLGIRDEAIPGMYMDAVGWADSLAKNQ